ncbi:MAG: hypothetical protein FJ090_12245 [Deltaproteobacteria bacterium]|nr:hypothetical protein [Deltaproteobacteria bacterium]
MFTLLAATALADTITLDSGAVIEGDLARYEMGGQCQLSVTEGLLVGVIAIVPCHRVLAFVRAAPVDAPVLAAVVAPEGPVVGLAVDEPLAPVEEENSGADRDAIGQPREAPAMPSVTTLSLSF